MKKIYISSQTVKAVKLPMILLVVCIPFLGIAQIDKEKLALDISKADEANTEKLKEYIWKRKSDVFVAGALKLTTITEFSFDAAGKLQAKLIETRETIVPIRADSL